MKAAEKLRSRRGVRERLFRPSGAWKFTALHPRLAPWAAFFLPLRLKAGVGAGWPRACKLRRLSLYFDAAAVLAHLASVFKNGYALGGAGMAPVSEVLKGT